MTKTTADLVAERLGFIVPALTALEESGYRKQGYNHFTAERHGWSLSERRKYYALDCGSSGAFLVERDTGEIFNIKGYGQPDKNKKLKANLGNILDCPPETLYTKRYNYLR